MSDPNEPVGTVSDEPAKGRRPRKHRLLHAVGLVLLCAVIGLGTWQLIVLHNEVSSLQSQNHSQQALARIQSELDGVQSLAGTNGRPIRFVSDGCQSTSVAGKRTGQCRHKRVVRK